MLLEGGARRVLYVLPSWRNRPSLQVVKELYVYRIKGIECLDWSPSLVQASEGPSKKAAESGDRHKTT
jgi:hypothetical protein